MRLVGCLVAAGLGLVYLARSGGERTAPVVAPPAVPSQAGPADAPRPAEVAPREVSRPAGGEAALTLRLVDLTGAPLAGLEVRAEDGTAATSRADGRLVLARASPADASGLQVPGWSVLARGELDVPGRGAEPTLLLAPSLSLAGRVVDRAGAPVRADVRALLRPELFTTAPLTPAGALDVVASAGASGRFALREVPAVPGAELLVTRSGYRPARLALPTRSTEDLKIVLSLSPARPARLGEVRVHGRVVDGAGEGWADTKVLFGDVETLSDGSGAFSFLVRYRSDEPPLVAVRAGFAPAVRPGFGTQVALATRDGRELPAQTLVLDTPAATLAGRLVGPSGKPLSGWTVDLLDATWMGPGPDAISAEELAEGRDHRRRTASDGRFRFGGLRPTHAYRVRAWRAETLRWLTSPKTRPGGPELILRLSGVEPRPRVSGTVSGRDGLPIAGVEVTLTLILDQEEGRARRIEGPSATTDAGGRFTLADVPRDELWLHCSGPAIADESFLLAPRDRGTDLALRVARLVRFRFETTGGPYAPTSVAVLDGNGTLLPLYRDGRPTAGARAPLKDGRSRRLTTTEDARWLAIYHGGDELERLPLRLVPGRVTLVRK